MNLSRVSEQIKKITIEDKEYPRLLKNISNPPEILYVRGTIFTFINSISRWMISAKEFSCHFMSAQFFFLYQKSFLNRNMAGQDRHDNE